MRACGVGEWSSENRCRGWCQRRGDATLHRKRRHLNRDRTDTGLADGAAGVGFSFLCELEGGDTGEETGHLQGLEKVGNCLCAHQLLVRLGFPGENLLHVDTRKVEVPIPTVYIQCPSLFKIRYTVFVTTEWLVTQVGTSSGAPGVMQMLGFESLMTSHRMGQHASCETQGTSSQARRLGSCSQRPAARHTQAPTRPS